MRPAELIDVEGACDGGEVPPRQRPRLVNNQPKGKQTMKLTKNELYRKPRWDVTAKENVVIED